MPVKSPEMVLTIDWYIRPIFRVRLLPECLEGLSHSHSASQVTADFFSDCLGYSLLVELLSMRMLRNSE